MNSVSDDERSSERTQSESRIEIDSNSKTIISKRFLPSGWCALLCKIKNQSICKDFTNHEHSSTDVEEKGTAKTDSISRVSFGTRAPQISADLQVTTQILAHPTSSFKIYVRPILPQSRPNLWRRTTECLAERNQLP